MTRKEILVFQLREIRNEFANALEDVTQEQLTATPIEGRNPIGWIVCHCLHNFNFFLYERQTSKSLMGADGEYGEFARYGWEPPSEQNPPPDFANLSNAVNEVFRACIEIVESLDEEALNNLPPYWHLRISSQRQATASALSTTATPIFGRYGCCAALSAIKATGPGKRYTRNQTRSEASSTCRIGRKSWQIDRQ